MALKGKELIVHYYAWNSNLDAPAIGDAEYHTIYWVKDDVIVTPVNPPEEVDAMSAAGLYKVLLTETETSCNTGTISGISSTLGIVIIPTTYTFDTDILQLITPYGHAIIGQGRGTTTVTDIVEKSGIAQTKIIVKAYVINNDLIDWSAILALDVSNGLGEFTLYLDPGDYMLSFEKNGAQIGTKRITVS
jgi:hypothetical protein